MTNATATAAVAWRCPHREPCLHEDDCKFSAYLDAISQARRWIMSLDDATAVDLLKEAIANCAVNPHIALLGMDVGGLLELVYGWIGKGGGQGVEITVRVPAPQDRMQAPRTRPDYINWGL